MTLSQTDVKHNRSKSNDYDHLNQTQTRPLQLTAPPQTLRTYPLVT